MTPRLGIQSVRAHLILSGISALLLALAFPPIGWGWLAWFALVPITILAVRSSSTWRLAWTVYLVSAVWWLVMIGWIQPVTMGGYFFLSLYMAVYLPATMVVVRLIDRRWRPIAVLSLPIVWVSFELVRGYILAGGFGWFALSHSQAPYLPHHSPSRIIQIADLLGEHGVSFLLAMTSGLIFDLLSRPLFIPTPTGKPRFNPMARTGLVIWSASLAFAIVYGQWRIGQFDAVTQAGPRVAVIQTNIPQDNKENPTLAQLADQWRRTVELTREAAETAAAQGSPVDLIVWPETIVPEPINHEAVQQAREHQRIWEQIDLDDARQFIEEEHLRQMAVFLDVPLEQVPEAQAQRYRWAREYRSEIAELAQAYGSTLMVGSSTVFTDPDYRRYNSALQFHADGTVARDRYDKIHRVPFGEFMPWIEWFPGLQQWFIRVLTPYDYDYTLQQGQSLTIFEMDWREGAEPVRLVTPICFEDTVPRMIRRLIQQDGRKQAAMIVNLTNDGWFAESSQPLQHMQIAVFRSIEHRVPTVRSVNTGVSGFIDSVGRVGPMVERDGAHQRVDGWTIHEVRLDSRTTIFGRIGHLPGMILVVVTGVLTLEAVAGGGKMKGR